MMMLDVSSIPWTQGRSQPRRSGGASASVRWAREWGRTNVSPSAAVVRGSRPPEFFCIFLIQNPAFWCILWLWKWALPVFLSRPLLLLWLLLLNTPRRNNVTDSDPSVIPAIIMGCFIIIITVAVQGRSAEVEFEWFLRLHWASKCQDTWTKLSLLRVHSCFQGAQPQQARDPGS